MPRSTRIAQGVVVAYPAGPPAAPPVSAAQAAAAGYAAGAANAPPASTTQVALPTDAGYSLPTAGAGLPGARADLLRARFGGN